MADPLYPLFPVCTFMGFFLALLPLPWHLKAWNSGTCFYMMWASLACLNQFINSVTWHNNAINWAPVWCEISIRIMMGSSVGLPAASLCINRRLYHIITNTTAFVSKREKTRAILIDSLICLLFPLLYVTLQYIIQGHRFNIYEDFGCFPALFNTLPMYFISAMWPLLIGLVSATYCILTLRVFTLRRIEFVSMLASHPSITIWRYFRLMALATTELLCTMPLSAFVIWLNATTTPIEPWISWEDTHFNYNKIEQIPALIWRSSRLVNIAVEFNRWVVPMCALVFFAFFGFAEESRKNYAVWLETIRSMLPVRFRSRCSSVLKPLKLGSKDPSFSSQGLSLPVVSDHKSLHVNISVESISNKDTGTPTSFNITHKSVSHPPAFFSPAVKGFSEHRDRSPPSRPSLTRFAISPVGPQSDTSSIRTCPW